MSNQELSRLEIMQRIEQRRLRHSQAAELIGLSLSQTKRLYASYKASGAEGLTSKRRGKPSNNRLPDSFKQSIMAIITENYSDFGPTLAVEKLRERHNVSISIETLRKWMVEAGLWKTRAQRLKRAYQPRYRRDSYGELIQIDGSNHAWFEDRAPKCTLLVFVDDATSALMALKFVDSESTYSYFDVLEDYLNRHGRPTAFYSDKLSVFRVNSKNPKGGDEITQFARALHELNIDIICANTCQAKGRVERANSTLQDRLVKELRLRKISDVDTGNAFLPEFIDDFNRKFKKEPLSPIDVHRPMETLHSLDDILCWKEERTVAENLTFRYNKKTYLLEDNLRTRKLRRKKITVYDPREGEISVYYNGESLPCSVMFDRLERVHPGAITENKRLGAVLQFVKEQQEKRNEQRSKSTPKKRRQSQQDNHTIMH